MQEISLLAPGFLVSMPQLADPNFSRAVVLMLEHNDEGSFGLIVNQESDLPLAELMAGIDADWTGDPAARAWAGGPVMPGSGWVLHDGSDQVGPASSTLNEALDSSGTMSIIEGLYMSTSVDNIKRLAHNPARHMRVLLGYSGWSGGQLAAEMAAGSWLHCDLDKDILFESPGEEMWERCLRKMGLSPESIVQSRGIH